MNYYAGIVTYNPNIQKLEENINAVADKFSRVILFDNGSGNIEKIKKIVASRKNIILINHGENAGLGYALNRIMEMADENHIEWVLLLDQDSVIPPNLLDRYQKDIFLERAAVISPLILDRSVKDYVDTSDTVQKIGVAFTSGTFNSVKIWKKVGKFNEEMFIDYIDNEYCIRLFLLNYNVYRDNMVVLDHQLGNGKKHWLKNTTNHNAKRRYYIARNAIYVAISYQKELRKQYRNKKEFRTVCLFLDDLPRVRKAYIRQFYFVVLVLMFEDEKYKKIKSIIKGLGDGRKMAKRKPLETLFS